MGSLSGWRQEVDHAQPAISLADEGPEKPLHTLLAVIAWWRMPAAAPCG